MIRRLLAMLVPLAVLAAVAFTLDGPEVMRRLAGADPRWLLAGLAVLWAQTVLSALRWVLVARALGQGMRFGRAVREYFVAQLGNQLLPGGVTGDALRAMRARRKAPSAGTSLAAVAVERLAGQVFMFAALALGLLLSFRHSGNWPPGLRPVLLAGLALLLLAAVVAVRLGRIGAVLRRGLAVPGQVPLGLAIVTLNLTAFACAAAAVGSPLSPVQVLVAVPLILSAMLIPLGHAGWGWREGAAAGLFPLIGLSAEAGVAASAAFGLLCLAAALPGAVWVLERHRMDISLPVSPPAAGSGADSGRQTGPAGASCAGDIAPSAIERA